VIADRGGVRWRPILLLFAVLALWFGFLEVRGLYFPDEGRYAEIPREMLATGDWVTPRLNGIPYFEKPPLQYWATAAIFAVAGQDEWTTRLWPAFGGLTAVIAVLLTVRRLFSKRAGWMAAAVMGSCWGYFVATQFVTLDMTLTAFMTGALCAFLVAQDARASTAERREYMLAAWALCGLAVLTKGVIGAALPNLARDGSVVALSGYLYRKPSAGYSPFAAVNGAIEALVKVLAIELAPIRINALVPGQIDTLRELIGEQANRGRVEAAAAKLPVGRIGTPEDVAHAALFLAENRFTTGTVLDVDGGER